MNFFILQYEEEKTWLELDNRGIATRQINFMNGTYHISCLEDCLAEGTVNFSDLSGINYSISEEQFEKKWAEVTEKYRTNWLSIKEKYKVNNQLNAKLLYYYPQGPIYGTKDALINYKGEKNAELHSTIDMTIIGYDDVNMWIIAE